MLVQVLRPAFASKTQLRKKAKPIKSRSNTGPRVALNDPAMREILTPLAFGLRILLNILCPSCSRSLVEKSVWILSLQAVKPKHNIFTHTAVSLRKHPTSFPRDT